MPLSPVGLTLFPALDTGRVECKNLPFSPSQCFQHIGLLDWSLELLCKLLHAQFLIFQIFSFVLHKIPTSAVLLVFLLFYTGYYYPFVDSRSITKCHLLLLEWICPIMASINLYWLGNHLGEKTCLSTTLLPTAPSAIFCSHRIVMKYCLSESFTPVVVSCACVLILWHVVILSQNLS